MSHFSVIVIGDNVEKQLAPYHEFECTGQDDVFVQDVDITDEIKQRMTDENSTDVNEALDYYGIGEDAILEALPNKINDDIKYGYAVVKDGVLIKAVNRTNPNRKWDWYQEGGRWSNYFKGKDGKEYDSIRKGDIDLVGMIEQEKLEAAAEYDKFDAILAGREIPDFEAIRLAHKDDIDAARNEYNSSQVVKDLRAAEMGLWGSPKERYGMGREAFIQGRADSRLASFAVIKDGQWFEKGSMGWFGMVSGEQEQSKWNAEFMQMFNALPDDTLITMVDCHI